MVASDHTGLSEAARGFTAAVLTPTDDPAEPGRPAAAGARRWDDYRCRAEHDAGRARQRYGPARFHAELAEAVVLRCRDGNRRRLARIRDLNSDQTLTRVAHVVEPA